MSNKRNEHARICQQGASNERKVAQCLVEAIDECRAEGVNPREDAAVFLINHQLAFLLTGHDICVGYPDMHDRWQADARHLGVI